MGGTFSSSQGEQEDEWGDAYHSTSIASHSWETPVLCNRCRASPLTDLSPITPGEVQKGKKHALLLGIKEVLGQVGVRG